MIGWVLFLIATSSLLVVYRQLLRLRAENVRLQELATTDPLTGLENKRGFSKRMKAAVAHALRKREPMTVLFIDLNDLRVHNNTRGHEFGDQVLVALASAMRASSWRVSDVLARTGGDEFAMVLPDTDVAGAVIVADRLISGIETRYVQHGEELVPIGISVGGAILSTAGDCPPVEEVVLENPDEHSHGLVERATDLMLVRADRNLYLAKAKKSPGISPIIIGGPKDAH